MTVHSPMHIALSRIRHAFGKRVVIDDLSLELREHRIGIIGANGSGKSTFVRLLNGLVVPDQGQVWVNGLSTRSDLKEVRKRVGFVFQNPDHQIVMPTVAEDLAFGLKNLRLDEKEIEARVQLYLEMFHLGDFADQPAHLMSGGEKQLLALAGVLIMEPDLVIMDEVTTLLDLRNTREIMCRIEAMRQPVIFVTHDLSLLKSFDRVIAFDKGRILADGSPEDVCAQYQEHMLKGV